MAFRTRMLLWLAQGFGLGRIPVAPGTWGTLLGLPLTALLLLAGNRWLYLLGLGVAVGVAVPVCGQAERALGRKDPGSVVLDEVVALPLAFLGWFWSGIGATGVWPGVEVFGVAANWLWLGVGFVAFRLLDILKPWPIRLTQALYGGFGVVADDVAAALIVALVWAGVRAL